MTTQEDFRTCIIRRRLRIEVQRSEGKFASLCSAFLDVIKIHFGSLIFLITGDRFSRIKSKIINPVAFLCNAEIINIRLILRTLRWMVNGHRSVRLKIRPHPRISVTSILALVPLRHQATDPGVPITTS